MRTGGNDGLFEFISRDVIHRLRFFARIVDCGLHLNGGHFFLKVRRTFFAETALGIPAIIIHPFAAAFAFVEMWLGFFDCGGESIIVCLLPACRPDVARRARRATKYTAEKITGGVQRAGYSSKR